MYWWKHLAVWTVQEFVFLTTYAIVLFLMASALFPGDGGRSDPDQATFERNRTWFFGLLLAAHLIDIPETAAKQADGLRAVPPQYWFAGPAFIAIALTGLLTSRRREFTGEVGIIVLGVLIALGAEQVIEGWHWRRVIKAERVALSEDVADIWNAMSGRMVVQGCMDQRLTELQTVFDRHNRGQPLGIAGPIGRPSVWSARTTALQIATADQSLSHMSAEAKRDYFA